MQPNKEITLRALKGAPLSVLVALFWFGPASRKGLVSRTGYGKDAVGDALNALFGMGLVVRLDYRKWALLDGNKLFEVQSYPQVFHNDPERRNNRLSASERRENRLSALVVSSSNTTIDKDEKVLDAQILGVCKELGIHGSKAESLAANREIVRRGPEFIRMHVWLAEREEQSIGLAIWRVERLWELSARQLEGYRLHCEVKGMVER